MFNFLKKFILLSTLISTHLLYADGVLTSIGINNAPSVSEADAGSKKMTFMVTLSESPLLFTTVNYTTVNGSATAVVTMLHKVEALLFWLGIQVKP